MTCLALLAALAAAPALAKAPAPAMPGMSQGAMPGMTPGMAPGMPMSANRMEMTQKMEAMDKAMMGAAMTGNPDQDLVAMMMPHHQGAIDMARIYLPDGKDPDIRRMAGKVITDQQREVAEFKAWQAKHPVVAR